MQFHLGSKHLEPLVSWNAVGASTCSLARRNPHHLTPRRDPALSHHNEVKEQRYDKIRHSNWLHSPRPSGNLGHTEKTGRGHHYNPLKATIPSTRTTEYHRTHAASTVPTHISPTYIDYRLGWLGLSSHFSHIFFVPYGCMFWLFASYCVWVGLGCSYPLICYLFLSWVIGLFVEPSLRFILLCLFCVFFSVLFF